MGTRSHPLTHLAYLGLGLLLSVSGLVRADLVRAEPEAPAGPLTAPAAPAELAELPSSGEFPLGAQTADWRTGDEVPFGGVTVQTATPWEAPPTNQTEHPDPPTTRLTANETSGLLMFQSLLLVAMVRKRREWAAALLAVLALSRSGLNAISELVGLPKTGAVSIPPPPETTSGPATRLDLPFAHSERAYAGLLRRLAGEPAALDHHAFIAQTNQEPATCLASRARVAGSAVPVALSSPEVQYVPAATVIAFLPPEGREAFPSRSVSYALFARPPPATA